MHTTERSSAGFTLIEVMVALSLLALGIAGTAKLTELGYRQLAAADETRQAAYFAHSHLNALSQADSQALLPQQGRYNSHFRWQLKLTPVPPASVKADVKLATTAPTVVVPATAISTAMRADLVVWMDNDSRAMEFHTLIVRRAAP